MFLKSLAFIALLAVCMGDDSPITAERSLFNVGSSGLNIGTATGTVVVTMDVDQAYNFLGAKPITISWPPAGTTVNTAVTQILVTRKSGSGTVSLISGGLGQTSAVIQLKSVFGPTSFTVIIRAA